MSDSNLPISRKVQREQERENAILRRRGRLEEAASTKLNASQKRKRNDVDDADPRLKEFLEAMQPASKAKTWDRQPPDDLINEPPTKTQAKLLTEEESDEEYETVSKKLRRSSSPEVPPELIPAAKEYPEPAERKNIVPELMAPDATDDDWLRGRTNRTLDLIDPDEFPLGKEASINRYVNPVTETDPDMPIPDNLEESPPAEDEWEGPKDDLPDPVIEAIKSNGRLFVRNLPYSATKDELREHFAPYGALEEVRNLFTYSFL